MFIQIACQYDEEKCSCAISGQFFVFTSLFWLQQKIEPSVDEGAFRAFVKCDTTREQDAILSQLRTSVTPIEKRSDLWIYDYKSKILGMNSDQVILGVCGEDGNVDCGWGSLIAFQLTESVSSAKSNLLESYGVDFTIEYRDEESEATLRPLLGKDENQIKLG